MPKKPKMNLEEFSKQLEGKDLNQLVHKAKREGEERILGQGTPLTVVVKKSGDQFVALCLELGVVGIGSDENDAIKDLRGAIDTLVTYLCDEGREHELLQRTVTIDRLRDFLLEEYEEEEEANDAVPYGSMEVIIIGRKEKTVAPNAFATTV